MRVECYCLDDFLEHLRVKGSLVYGNVVYVNVNTNPLDDNRRNAVRFMVVFQASAVIDLQEGSQYLLQTGEDCGVDVRDAIPSYEGTEMAKRLRHSLESFCAERGLSLLPGIVSE